MKYLITYTLLYCVTGINNVQKTLIGKDTVLVGKEVTKCDTIRGNAREFLTKDVLDEYIKRNQVDMLEYKVYEFKGKLIKELKTLK